MYGQMVDIGYGNYNCILNLGSLSIFWTIYIFHCFYTLLIFIINKFTGKYSKHLKSMKEKLFFNAMFELILDGYYEFLISGYL